MTINLSWWMASYTKIMPLWLCISEIVCKRRRIKRIKSCFVSVRNTDNLVPFHAIWIFERLKINQSYISNTKSSIKKRTLISYYKSKCKINPAISTNKLTAFYHPTSANNFSVVFQGNFYSLQSYQKHIQNTNPNHQKGALRKDLSLNKICTRKPNKSLSWNNCLKMNWRISIKSWWRIKN